MKRIPILLVVVMTAVLLFGAACAPASRKPKDAPSSAQNVSSTSSGNATNGKKLFAGTCVSCHGPDAKGLPNLGKNLTTSQFVKSQSDTQLLTFVKTGRPASDPANTTGLDMPPRGGNPALNDANLKDIIAFLRTINK